jgi:hypothetical protein
MRVEKYILWSVLLLIGAGIFAACVAPQGATLLATTSTPAPSSMPATTATSEPVAAQPIVSTAISQSSQGLPTPSETPKVGDAAGPTITMGDNGKTLTLQSGQRFVLLLNDRYVWEVSVAEPEVASLVMGLAAVNGSQGVYEAHQAGQTQLTAMGDPLCRSQKPACMMPTLIFTLDIVVQ